MSAPSQHNYRREIDGLRAIAVVSVVLFHFGVPGFAGGFVGVDIFFVISGFLIGGLLWNEHRDTGRIKIGAFYLRRFRRLAPAFFVMAFFTAIAAWHILLPFEFREFGKALIASAVYLSNVLFFRSAGYFDSAAEEKPLLHTWSLSVEEQFYIVLPLVLLLLARWPRLCFAVLVGTATASLTASILITPTNQPATFYLFPFRAWELLAGVLLAIWGHGRAQDWDAHPALSWLGIALIVGGIILIEPGPTFPGTAAVIPVLGTVLLLMNGRNENPVNRVLSRRVPVFLGLISYSLYLWHWPIVTLGGYWLGHFTPMQTLLAVNLSLSLAILSWAFVERPVRRAQNLGPMRLVGGVVAGSAILLAIGAGVFLRDGFPSRFDPTVSRHIAASGDFLQDFNRCRIEQDGPLQGVETCPIGPDGAPRVLVWGDSHARAWHDGIAQSAAEAETPGLLIWTAGCPPLFGVEKTEKAATPAEDARCSAINSQIQTALPQMEGFDKILLVGRWTYYASGTGVGLDADNTISVTERGGDVAQADALGLAWGNTVNTLLDHFNEILVLRQVPEIPNYDSRVIARALAHKRITPEAATNAASVARADIAEREIQAAAPIRDLDEVGAITLIDTWDALCSAEACRAAPEGPVWYFDNNHLSNTGARALRGVLAPVFASDEGGL